MRRFHLFLFFLAVYALTSSGNAFRVPDEFEVYFQTEHLVDAGDLSVPQTLAIHQDGAPILVGGITSLGMAFAAALAVAGFHRASIALGASPRTALQLSAIVGLATMLW